LQRYSAKLDGGALEGRAVKDQSGALLLARELSMRQVVEASTPFGMITSTAIHLTCASNFNCIARLFRDRLVFAGR
jgi:hypothetical protein